MYEGFESEEKKSDKAEDKARKTKPVVMNQVKKKMIQKQPKNTNRQKDQQLKIINLTH